MNDKLGSGHASSALNAEDDTNSDSTRSDNDSVILDVDTAPNSDVEYESHGYIVEDLDESSIIDNMQDLDDTME